MFKIILPKLSFKIEKWKWNKEYRIYVSTLGHIKNEYKQNVPIKINQSGYCLAKTNCGYKLIHRLVMLTFKPIPNAEDLTVDHLNHNKRDNSVYNLEWVTQEENLKRAKEDCLSVSQLIFPKQRIKAGQKIFNNIDEAINYIVKKSASNGSVPNRENIRKRINQAIITKTLYHKQKWSIV